MYGYMCGREQSNLGDRTGLSRTSSEARVRTGDKNVIFHHYPTIKEAKTALRAFIKMYLKLDCLDNDLWVDQSHRNRQNKTEYKK